MPGQRHGGHLDLVQVRAICSNVRCTCSRVLTCLASCHVRMMGGGYRAGHEACCVWSWCRHACGLADPVTGARRATPQGTGAPEDDTGDDADLAAAAAAAEREARAAAAAAGGEGAAAGATGGPGGGAGQDDLVAKRAYKLKFQQGIALFNKKPKKGKNLTGKEGRRLMCKHGQPCSGPKFQHADYHACLGPYHPQASSSCSARACWAPSRPRWRPSCRGPRAWTRLPSATTWASARILVSR